MGIFEPTQVVVAEGTWKVRVRRTADSVDCISHDRAMMLADELEAEGWKECAAQVRKAAQIVRRFQAYTRP
jgi:hypothetical protein